MPDRRNPPEYAEWLEALTERVLAVRAAADALTHEPPRPTSLRLLLRHFVASQRDDIGAVLEPALGYAIRLTSSPQSIESDGPGWLMLFVEAATVSDDARLTQRASAITETLRDAWPTAAGSALFRDMQSLTACFAALASEVVTTSDRLAADAVDELERLIGLRYRPSVGMVRLVAPQSPPPLPVWQDQVSTAAALLTAHFATGRLPYAMLAEELMQGAMRARQSRGDWPRAAAPGNETDEAFVCDCRAVDVLSRMAALHDDDGYRSAAVIAAAADYHADARQLLDAVTGAADQRSIEASAELGLVVFDWLTLR